jgi:hypothetical protein
MKLMEIEDRVRQIRWPAPPPNLRARVLSTATIATEPITWSDRMWFSRAWRLSAVAAALIVIGFELQPSPTRPVEPGPTPQALAEARSVEEIGRQAGLSADLAAWFARRALSAGTSPRAGTQEWTALGIPAADGERR